MTAGAPRAERAGQVAGGVRGAGAPRAERAGQVAGGVRGAGAPRVLLLDNYDSFTYNLVQYLGELGAEVDVVRNDRASADELLERARGGRLIVSPGPCTPAEAGVSVEAIRRLGEERVPVLGVCLGHQAIATAFGGRVVRGEPVHGKAAEVTHDGRTIFAGLETPLEVGRYHSLVIDPELPPELERTAAYGDVVMGVRHRELPVEGVQFHPESVLTRDGMAILRNFLSL
jgi:anthranilate synthase/aminodeoxychorismate synthase-like glutamine amidotransferase